MDVANAQENLLEMISRPAHVEEKVVEACQLHITLNVFQIRWEPFFHRSVSVLLSAV